MELDQLRKYLYGLSPVLDLLGSRYCDRAKEVTDFLSCSPQAYIVALEWCRRNGIKPLEAPFKFPRSCSPVCPSEQTLALMFDPLGIQVMVPEMWRHVAACPACSFNAKQQWQALAASKK